PPAVWAERQRAQRIRISLELQRAGASGLPDANPAITARGKDAPIWQPLCRVSVGRKAFGFGPLIQVPDTNHSRPIGDEKLAAVGTEGERVGGVARAQVQGAFLSQTPPPVVVCLG